MKWNKAFSWVFDWWTALQVGGPSVIRAIFNTPGMLLQPASLSDLMMAHIWVPFGDGIDQNSRKIKQNLITPNARGVVLDLGAGYGHTAKYLVKSKVTTYIAIEPNPYMHERLCKEAAAAGFHENDGTFILIACGVEDLPSYLSVAAPEIQAKFPVDTIISILAMCSFPDTPSQPLSLLLRQLTSPKMLRPRTGEFLFYEHVLQTERADVRFWQRFWTKSRIWRSVFAGCRMDVPAHELLKDLGISGQGKSSAIDAGSSGSSDSDAIWSEGSTWGNEGEDPENLFWHQQGRFVAR